jgi:hypothetical protein
MNANFPESYDYLLTNCITVTSNYLTGNVALIVGGNGPVVEVYSPDGNCQQVLSDVTVGTNQLHLPALAYIDGKIICCNGHLDGSQAVSKSFKCSLCEI